MNDKDISKAHVKWYMGDIRCLIDSLLDFFEQALIEHMEHGIKHGREDEREERQAEKNRSSNDI